MTIHVIKVELKQFHQKVQREWEQWIQFVQNILINYEQVANLILAGEEQIKIKRNIGRYQHDVDIDIVKKNRKSMKRK